MDSRIMPFIVLHHKMSGDKFITGYRGNYNSYDAYEILGFANSIPEAQKILHPTDKHRTNALRLWYAKTMADMESKGLGLSEEGKQHGLEILLNARD